MWRKGRQSWEGWEISNKDIFWVTVTLSSSQSKLPLPLHQKLTCTFHTCRHMVYHLGSNHVLFTFLGNPRLHHCRPVPCPGWGKKIPSISVMSGCLGWTLVFSGRNHSDGWEKSECWNHLHPLWLLRIPTVPGAPILGLLHRLYCLCGGEPGYDYDHQNQSQTSHPHVLLSQPSLLSWFLLFFYNHTQTLRDPGCGHKDYLLHGLHDVILLVCTLVITEMFMLAVMAYDLFVAVCNPLLYIVAVSPKLCIFLVTGTYTWSGTWSLTVTCSLLGLSFCGSNIIHHFGCEYSAIVSASCSDSYFSQMTCFIISTLNKVCCLLIILAS